MNRGGTVAPRPVRLKPARIASLFIIVGVAFVGPILAAWHDTPARTIAMALALGGLAAWIAWQDLRTFTIPDGATAALAILALNWRLAAAGQGGVSSLATVLELGIDVALPGGALLAFREIHFRRRGFDGIGFGDIKLAAAGGLLVGTVGFSWALFAASALGLVFVGATRLSPKSRDKAFASSEKIAFGALLAPAIWTVWIAQQMPVFG